MDLISREKAAGIFISSHLLATLNEDHESASFSISVDKKEQRANSYIFRCVVDSKFGFWGAEIDILFPKQLLLIAISI